MGYPEDKGGLLGYGVKYDFKYLVVPSLKPASFVLPFIAAVLLGYNYFCYGSFFPSKEDYDNKRINNEAVLDSTKVDSIPDSVFISKPNPLEKRLE